jgi:hypothetical protein
LETDPSPAKAAATTAESGASVPTGRRWNTIALARFAITVRSLTVSVLGVFHLAEVAKKALVFLILLKNLQSFPILQVVTNCPISSPTNFISPRWPSPV